MDEKRGFISIRKKMMVVFAVLITVTGDVYKRQHDKHENAEMHKTCISAFYNFVWKGEMCIRDSLSGNVPWEVFCTYFPSSWRL